jgi:cell division protein FtsL
MALGFLTVVVLITVPLLVVWKQAYIARTSAMLEKLTDTLSAQNREVARLRLQCENVSRTERIEAFARKALLLDYPATGQIVIVRGDDTSENRSLYGKASQLLASARSARSGKGGGL